LKVFGFSLDEKDKELLEKSFNQTHDLPGDCGDEYRKPPYLTASGDLSHHLKAEKKASTQERHRQNFSSGTKWEPMAGYSRAVRVGSRILVSGTTATHGAGTIVCRGDVEGQTVYALDKIAAAIEALGGRLEDVVRTRVYLKDASKWEPVARVHGRYFGDIRPVNTMIGIADFVGDYEIEIEAEAALAAS
jgi:enamine deaminase RidA (YjgF/YER057c/UK114 family)